MCLEYLSWLHLNAKDCPICICDSVHSWDITYAAIFQLQEKGTERVPYLPTDVSQHPGAALVCTTYHKHFLQKHGEMRENEMAGFEIYSYVGTFWKNYKGTEPNIMQTKYRKIKGHLAMERNHTGDIKQNEKVMNILPVVQLMRAERGQINSIWASNISKWQLRGLGLCFHLLVPQMFYCVNKYIWYCFMQASKYLFLSTTWTTVLECIYTSVISHGMHRNGIRKKKSQVH